MSSKPPSSDLKITSKSRTQDFRNVSKNSNCRFKLSKCVKLIFILRLATSIWKIPLRRMTKKIPRKLLHHENDFIAKWSIKFLKTYSSLLEKSKIIMSNSFPYKEKCSINWKWLHDFKAARKKAPYWLFLFHWNLDF